MHTDNKFYLDLKHEGVTPASWAAGDQHFQKAKFIAMVAWSLFKPPTDPELPFCDLSHQERLIGEVESLMAGNKPGSAFGRKAMELIKELPEDQLQR